MKPTVATVCLLLCPLAACADARSKAILELAKSALRKAGGEATEAAAGVLARRIEVAAVRHGDDVLRAVEKAGRPGLKAIEEAGEQGAKSAAATLARHGAAALPVVERPEALRLVTALGDDAGAALVRSGPAVEPVLVAAGRPAAAALARLEPQNARRLAMLFSEADTTVLARDPRLLAVVGRFGDRAMAFVWKHKAPLTVVATLAAFVNDPEPFLDGLRDLAEVGAEQIVRPAIEAVVPGIAGHTDWTWVFISLVVAGSLVVGLTVRAVGRQPQPAPALPTADRPVS